MQMLLRQQLLEPQLQLSLPRHSGGLKSVAMQKLARIAARFTQIALTTNAGILKRM
jgi:hypothetical protein